MIKGCSPGSMILSSPPLSHLAVEELYQSTHSIVILLPFDFRP